MFLLLHDSVDSHLMDVSKLKWTAPVCGANHCRKNWRPQKPKRQSYRWSSGNCRKSQGLGGHTARWVLNLKVSGDQSVSWQWVVSFKNIVKLYHISCIWFVSQSFTIIRHMIKCGKWYCRYHIMSILGYIITYCHIVCVCVCVQLYKSSRSTEESSTRGDSD